MTKISRVLQAYAGSNNSPEVYSIEAIMQPHKDHVFPTQYFGGCNCSFRHDCVAVSAPLADIDGLL